MLQNLEAKKINDEKKAALAAQFAAEATLRRVHAGQKDEDMPPIEAILAPLEAELKLARQEACFVYGFGLLYSERVTYHTLFTQQIMFFCVFSLSLSLCIFRLQSYKMIIELSIGSQNPKKLHCLKLNGRSR